MVRPNPGAATVLNFESRFSTFGTRTLLFPTWFVNVDSQCGQTNHRPPSKGLLKHIIFPMNIAKPPTNVDTTSPSTSERTNWRQPHRSPAPGRRQCSRRLLHVYKCGSTTSDGDCHLVTNGSHASAAPSISRERMPTRINFTILMTRRGLGLRLRSIRIALDNHFPITSVNDLEEYHWHVQVASIVNGDDIGTLAEKSQCQP